MIRINSLYESMTSAYGTSQYGFFRPATDFVPAIHDISLEIFNKLVGLDERSQRIEDWLSPFLVTENITVQVGKTFQYITKPKEYEGFNSAYILVQGGTTKGEVDAAVRVDDTCLLPADIREDFFVKADENYDKLTMRKFAANKWSSVLRHPSIKPTMKKPAMTPRVIDKKEGFEVAPNGIGVVVLQYYRKPVAPVFNYDVLLDGPDEYLQFKESGSQHLEWSETLTPVFLYYLGNKFGMQIHDQLTLQVKQLDKTFLT